MEKWVRRSVWYKLKDQAAHSINELLRGGTVRLALITLVAMLAFAGNSLLCRVALKVTGIDAAIRFLQR